MIRVRAGKRTPGCIQVITSRFDPSAGRNRQKVIARLEWWTDTLPERVAVHLTEGERANAEAFFAARREQRRLSAVPEAVAALIVQGEIVRDALQDARLRNAALAAAALYGLGSAITETCAALTAAGVPLRMRVKAAGRRPHDLGSTNPDPAPDTSA